MKIKIKIKAFKFKVGQGVFKLLIKLLGPLNFYF